MIKVLKKIKPQQEQKPYYSVTIDYMMGDADGDTHFTERIEVEEEEKLEKFKKVLDKLRPTKGYWGVSLDPYRLENHLHEGQITQEEYDFMKPLFEYGEYDCPFKDLLRSETEHTYLTYQGITIKYVDEWGEEFDTVISR